MQARQEHSAPAAAAGAGANANLFFTASKNATLCALEARAKAGLGLAVLTAAEAASAATTATIATQANTVIAQTALQNMALAQAIIEQEAARQEAAAIERDIEIASGLTISKKQQEAMDREARVQETASKALHYIMPIMAYFATNKIWAVCDRQPNGKYILGVHVSGKAFVAQMMPKLKVGRWYTDADIKARNKKESKAFKEAFASTVDPYAETTPMTLG